MHFAMDSTGYPLIYIEPLESWLQLLPVSKMQFEQFLAQPNEYDDHWYEQLLALNPRVPFRHFDRTNYEQLFLTGIRPDEAQDFARWLGQGFRLPTVPEWREAYGWLIEQSALPRPGVWDGLSLSAQVIWKRLWDQQISGELRLAHQALLENGVLEWVSELGTVGSRSGGMGTPRPNFWSILRQPTDEPAFPLDLNNRITLRSFGFRLLRSSL